MIRTTKKFSSEQERIKYLQKRLHDQQDAPDFGGAFWLLTAETSGKDFMSNPGYIKYKNRSRDYKKKPFEAYAIGKMESHVRNWGEEVTEWGPKLDLKLYINGEEWDKETIWTETDTLFCRGLQEVNNFLKKALA